ncbi:hypothetical protein Tco_1524706 [Tanacetum coccineum]
MQTDPSVTLSTERKESHGILPQAQLCCRPCVNFAKALCTDTSVHGRKAHNKKLKDVRCRLTYPEDIEKETKSASRHKKRKRRGSEERRGRSRRSPSQASSRSASVFSRLGAKGKKNEGKMRKNSYEAMSLILASVNEKMNGNTEGAKGPTQDEGDDLSEPYDEESTTPFTQSINKFVFPKWIRMPSTVKTYDGTGDQEDHLKTFTTAAKVERWAMPTRCHMFNVTLLGSAWLWFDELPPESIDSFKDLRRNFLAHYL